MNDQLKIFIAVVENHSFNKAAAELFISAPAVIKQINSLENKTKVTLFYRSHNGVTLTEAGKSFYQDALKLVEAYNQSVNRARNLSTEKEIVKIGAGPFASGTSTQNIWIEIGKNNPNLVFKFIPCSCSFGNFNEFLAGIGKDFDLVSAVYDQNLLDNFSLNAFQINETQLQLSVPIEHPLVKKEKLSLTDLHNQTVCVPVKGMFQSFDQARKVLEQDSSITIKDINGFDMNALNSCVENNWLLVSVQDWAMTHPLLKIKNINWNCPVPFGLLYKDNSLAIKKIIQYLEKSK